MGREEEKKQFISLISGTANDLFRNQFSATSAVTAAGAAAATAAAAAAAAAAATNIRSIKPRVEELT